MNKYEACKILGIQGDINPSIVKTAYRRACAKYHPDRNPGGLEMMKAVNLAFDCLKDLNESIEISEECANYGDDLMDIINALTALNLELELCGSWLWISGDTRTNKDAIKDLGCKWAPKKKLWYYRPADYKSRGRGKMSMDDIRATHGSQSVKGQSNSRIKAA